MKSILITFLVLVMLTINVSAGTDGENNLSKKPEPTKIDDQFAKQMDRVKEVKQIER